MAGEAAKRGPFVALVAMLVILLHITLCGAATSTLEDNATSPYHGRMDEPAWMFDSEISRMLIHFNNQVTPGTKKQNKPAVPCGPGQRYGDCYPQKNGMHKGEICDPYKRKRNCPP